MTKTCLNCHAKKSKILYQNYDYITRKAYPILKCLQCKLVQTKTPSLSLNKAYTPNYYGNQQGKRFHPFIEWSIHHLRKSKALYLNNLSRHKKIIDIGCGRGIFLQYLKKMNWEVWGTELNPQLIKHGQQRGIQIITPQQFHNLNKTNYFGIITMYHVLEHLSDVSTTLNKTHQLLSSQGLIIIEVPNLDSLQSNLSQGKWFHLDAPRHLTHFTPYTLSQILKSHDFMITSTTTLSLEYGYYGFIQSLLNLVCLEPNYLYSLLKGQNRLKTKAEIQSFFITVTLIIPLTLISILAETYAAIILNRGGILRITAKKI